MDYTASKTRRGKTNHLITLKGYENLIATLSNTTPDHIRVWYSTLAGDSLSILLPQKTALMLSIELNKLVYKEPPK